MKNLNQREKDMVANKKSVDNTLGEMYIRGIKKEEIVKQVDFGTFVVTQAKHCIIFHNYTGYTITTRPYTATPMGKATEWSLYRWLKYISDIKEYLEAHPNEEFEETGITCEDFLFSIKTITETNLLKPSVVFTDYNYALEEALKYIEWLAEKQQQLLETIEAEAPEEDEAANAEFEEQRLLTEQLSDIDNAKSK